jgi:drug/metabolite transporter (DMT)-like permease
MAATGTSSSTLPVSTPSVPPAGAPSDSGSHQPPVPPKIAALLAGLTALTGAVIGLMTSFNAGHWTSEQTTLVATEVAAFWALAAAVTAHLWPQTKRQPVAVAGTVTAFVSGTLSLGIGFAWWQLTQSQNASLISLITAIVAVASALVARSTVTPVRRQPAEAERDLS